MPGGDQWARKRPDDSHVTTQLANREGRELTLGV
jgi:hypothetical protein